MKIPRSFFLASLIAACTACDTAEIPDLWYNFLADDSILAEKDLFVADTVTGRLNYVKALYSSRNSCKIYCETGPAYHMDKLLQAFAVIGDHENIVGHAQINPCRPDSIRCKKMPPVFHPAHRYILEQFKSHRVIMFNETPDRVQCRVFVLEMLEDLRKAGATHLALEGLNNRTASPGQKNYECYGAEPIYAQIIRKAKKLGFQLVAYDDTARGNKGDTREKWQAVNLYEKIKKADTLAKTVVLAGYSHISEDSLPGFRMMAWYFSLISKTDPLTVDQVDLIESSPENRTARQLFDQSHNSKLTKPVVLDKQSMHELLNNCETPAYLSSYDLYVYHPQTEYTFRRPRWLITKEKQLIAVKIPGEISPVLVQAYLKPEINSAGDCDFKVPADQAFQVYKNEVHLVLDRSSDYTIVFRDPENKIIRTETISVR